MKTIVFIGTQKSGSSREAIKAGEQLGYYTVLLTDRPTFLEKRTEFPDVHLMELCNLNDLEEIRKTINSLILKALTISAIVSFTDPHCYTACLLAEEFGVNRFSTHAIDNMLNKIRSREILSQSPFTPKFFILSESQPLSKVDVKKHLPMIIKSPNSTGSKDVFKIATYEDFKRCTKKLSSKYPGEQILAEEFLDGPQYLVETIMYENNLHIIAIFKQEITFVQRFIITGYSLVLNPSENFYEELKDAVEFIVRSHGMESGPCHLEMRYVRNQWMLIEVNPRISGGGMNNLILEGLGINLVEETLKISLDQKPNLMPRFKVHVFAQYITLSQSGILDKVTGRNRAYKCPGVKSIYIKPRKGSLLTPPLSMGNRYAYVIATGKNDEEAKQNAKYAASQIQFHLLPLPEENMTEITKEDKFNNTTPSGTCLEGPESNIINQNRSEDTVKSFISDLFEYLEWFEKFHDKQTVFLEKQNILQYIDYLKEATPLSSETINFKLNSLMISSEFLFGKES
jgi:biotin carboxylase